MPCGLTPQHDIEINRSFQMSTYALAKASSYEKKNSAQFFLYQI